jgi:membrane protease YdiL (CAAX protease family)
LKKIRIELLIVFALSLGASAVYSLVSLIAKLTADSGLASSTAVINRSLSDREWLDFTYQILAIGFGLSPVALVLFLLWQQGRNPFVLLGLNFLEPKKDILRGFLLAALIGIPGLGLYLLSRIAGLSAEVIPANLTTYWWVIPILLMAAVKAALLEEVVVIGYFYQRLAELGWSDKKQIVFSALVRGVYHLYQGFGGFVGNFIMGLVFGSLYKKWGRVMPLVVAHFLLDAVVFVGFSLLSGVLQLP